MMNQNVNLVSNGASHVPAFLAKLWRIVDDPSTNDLICWSEAGNSFIIRNQAKFARELLPLYYKHNNMASFVRQLNMYGFHKVVSVEQGGLRVEKDEMEFAHPYFLQGNEVSLELIKRKIPASKLEETKGRPDSLNKVLLDVRQMKGRQESMDSKLHNMKRENEALWRELSALRQKHAKQQQIVSKLLQFLVSMMSSQSHRISFKRRMPLMINDADAEGKPSKLSRPENNNLNMNEDSNGPVIHEIFETDEPMVILSIPDEARNEDQQKIVQQQFGDLLNIPQIQENPRSPKTIPKTTITVTDGNNQAGGTTTTIPIVTHPTNNATGAPAGSVDVASPAVSDFGLSIHSVESSGSSGSGSPLPPEMNNDLSTQYIGNTSTDMVPMNMDLMGVGNGSGTRQTEGSPMNMNRPEVQNKKYTNYARSQGPYIQDDLDEHLDTMEAGLESLKDLLQGTQYNIDSSTLTGVGTSDTSASQTNSNFNPAAISIEQLFEMSPEQQIFGLVKENKEKEQQGFIGGNSVGQEMVSYNPCLFELAEDDAHFFEDSPNAIMLDDELESMLTTDRENLNGGKIGK